MKYLIVIPARGGSKGIKKKNIFPVLGKPLIMYSLDLLKQLDFCGDIVVSTDSEEIMDVVLSGTQITRTSLCMNIGKDINTDKLIHVIRRPEDISGDCAKTEDALIHSLDIMESYYDTHYDAVVTFQATSPLREVETVKRCFESFEKNREKYDALLTLSETRTDYWVKGNESYHRLFPDAPRRRQDRQPLYVENSMLYITDSLSLKKTGIVLGESVNGFVISEREAVDINNPIDIIYAESILKQNNNTFSHEI